MALSKYWKDNLLLWLQAAAVRAVKTAAQTAVGVIGAAAAMGEVSWALVGSSALLAAIVSLLTSVAGVPEVDDGTSVAGLVKAPETGEAEGE